MKEITVKEFLNQIYVSQDHSPAAVTFQSESIECLTVKTHQSCVSRSGSKDKEKEGGKERRTLQSDQIRVIASKRSTYLRLLYHKRSIERG